MIIYALVKQLRNYWNMLKISEISIFILCRPDSSSLFLKVFFRIHLSLALSRSKNTCYYTLWIIKWSNAVNDVDCFEIAKRALANYGCVFDSDDREVAWAIIRLLEKEILSSIIMGPCGDLPIALQNLLLSHSCIISVLPSPFTSPVSHPIALLSQSCHHHLHHQ